MFQRELPEEALLVAQVRLRPRYDKIGLAASDLEHSIDDLRECLADFREKWLVTDPSDIAGGRAAAFRAREEVVRVHNKLEELLTLTDPTPK